MAGSSRDGCTTPIWARQSGRRSTLTREAIVKAALEIADAEGIGAVSIRRVAAALSARTMTLYTHIDSKDDLLDLLADQVVAEVIIDDELPDDWREAITLIARRERQICLRHPWIVDMARHRTHAMVGPNTLHHLDQSVAAMAGLKLDPPDAYRVSAAIGDYVLGFVTREACVREIARHTGPSGMEQLLALRPYLKRFVDRGEFSVMPLLSRGDASAADVEFERGLRWLLDGIEREYS